MRCARLALALGDAERARDGRRRGGSRSAPAAAGGLGRPGHGDRGRGGGRRGPGVSTGRPAPPAAPRRPRCTASGCAPTRCRHGSRRGGRRWRSAVPAAARRHLAAAAASARGQSLLVRLRGHVASALLHEAAGSPAAVLRHSRAGLADLARHRAALPSVELRVLAAGHGAELGDHGLRRAAADRAGRSDPDWIERTRAASLLAVQPPVPDVEEDVTALRGVEREIKAARRERGEDPPELLARQSALEARIRRRSWGRDGVGGGPHDIAVGRRPAPAARR